MTLPDDAPDSNARRITEARTALRLLDFDAERSNERSALVLLALLALPPGQPWSAAGRPLLRTVEIMDWLRMNYSKDYKPNTRETIRRFTLHQFCEAGLVVHNPDKPTRPVNSPLNCYQISPAAHDLLTTYHRPAFSTRLSGYQAAVPSLRALYARERVLTRIPVTLPDGTAIQLSPGGQNVLIKQIIDEFCARYTPGGHVLYVGDADEKWSVFRPAELAALGVTVDSHGKMPDLVIHLADRNWLVLIEAATSHGPVDAKRHHELLRLFAGSTAGLVFISAFPTRAELRQHLKAIAWETDVWCADNPTHLIHFDGERFLGPHPRADLMAPEPSEGAPASNVRRAALTGRRCGGDLLPAGFGFLLRQDVLDGYRKRTHTPRRRRRAGGSMRGGRRRDSHSPG